jgi:protein-tyrosine kinase
MENIRQALERAKGSQKPGRIGIDSPHIQGGQVFGDAHNVREWVEEVELDVARLQSRRIVSYDGMDPRSRAFDMLRTEILQTMSQRGWKSLAVTSPTPSCGKTLIAVNLALSMARQPESRIFLADVDLRKPQVASCLGLKDKEGVVGVVEGRTELYRATVRVRAGSSRLEVLPTAPAANSSDIIGSGAMRTLLDAITKNTQSQIVILDMPPLLTGHDVISILPHVDCVLLVAAAGTTTASEIKLCSKHLEETNVVRFVLNKVPELTTQYAYY